MSVFKTFRDKHGLTQSELATAIGLKSQAAISQYENEERSPELPIARKFIAFAKKKGDSYTLEDVYSSRAH
jgi:DNA-binding XRE family transcriptional regulator